MLIKTWVGRFAIVQGQAQEESALLRSFPRQRPDEEEDELYVLVEPASERSIEYAGQLVDAIGRMYRQDTLSITGAVLRALKAAQQQLLDWNERNLKEHRVGAGVSCMAVRGHSAYLAQIGPAVAYHVGGGRYRRIVPEGPAVEPLGHAEGAEPVFSRYELSPGDLLLIASPNIEKLLSEEELRAILLRGGDDALVELFRIASDVQDFSLVLLACVVEPDEAAGEAPAEPVAESAPATTVTPPGEPAPATASEPATPAVAAPAAAGAPPPPPDLAQPNVRIKGPEADIRYRRSTGLAAGLPRVPLQAVIALVVLAAVAALAWFVLPSALQDSRDDRFAELVSSARASFDSALATDDPAQRRAAL